MPNSTQTAPFSNNTPSVAPQPSNITERYHALNGQYKDDLELQSCHAQQLITLFTQIINLTAIDNGEDIQNLCCIGIDLAGKQITQTQDRLTSLYHDAKLINKTSDTHGIQPISESINESNSEPNDNSNPIPTLKQAVRDGQDIATLGRYYSNQLNSLTQAISKLSVHNLVSDRVITDLASIADFLALTFDSDVEYQLEQFQQALAVQSNTNKGGA